MLVGRLYTNTDWCRGEHRKIMPQSCAKVVARGHHGITNFRIFLV